MNILIFIFNDNSLSRVNKFLKSINKNYEFEYLIIYSPTINHENLSVDAADLDIKVIEVTSLLTCAELIKQNTTGGYVYISLNVPESFENLLGFLKQASVIISESIQIVGASIESNYCEISIID